MGAAADDTEDEMREPRTQFRDAQATYQHRFARTLKVAEAHDVARREGRYEGASHLYGLLRACDRMQDRAHEARMQRPDWMERQAASLEVVR
jgi:hypothetical protein